MKKAAAIGMSLFVVFGWIIADTFAGTAFLSEPPESILEGEFQLNSFISWFFEGQTTLSNELDVDITSPGEYTQGSVLSNGAIAAGATVNSYLLHFDPVGQPSAPAYASGTFRFPQPIAGINVLDASLDDTDLFGAPGTNYPTAVEFRGLEFGTGSVADLLDFFGLRDIKLDLAASGVGVDQVRVFTKAPIPTTALLLGCGIVGLVGFRRKLQR